MFYVTAFGFVGCILFVFRICAILDWLQRRACKIQSVWGASVILVPHRFMGGIFPDCRDVHVSKPGWPHDLLLLGISWQDPNAEDGQQGEPVGNALYFLFGHLSTVSRLLALPGVLFFDEVLMLSHTVDAESHSLRLPQGSTMRTCQQSWKWSFCRRNINHSRGSFWFLSVVLSLWIQRAGSQDQRSSRTRNNRFKPGPSKWWSNDGVIAKL